MKTETAVSVIQSEAKDLAWSHGEKGLLGETKVNGAEAHSSGKINLPSSQTDAHFASASQPTLIAFSDLKVPRRPSAGSLTFVRDDTGEMIGKTMISTAVSVIQSKAKDLAWSHGHSPSAGFLAMLEMTLKGCTKDDND